VSATVLIVDDNDDNVHILRTFLLRRGYEIRIARDGASALESVRQQRPDVILLDVMMPGMDGMQVLDSLKLDPKTASIPVVMVTAKGGDRDMLAGYESGADYYIAKPFTPHQVLYAIGLVLGSNAPG
jgi:CheY-like chemotaxis protein